MMSILGAFLAAGLLLHIALVEGTPQNVSKIERLIYDRCRIYSTDASSYDEVKKHLGQFSDYLKYTASLLPNGKEQFCNDERPRLVQLMQELARDLKPCLPKEERYLPQFIDESFREFLSFTCAEKNMQNFFSSQGSDCRNKLKSGNAGEEVGVCFQKLFAGLDDSIKKDVLCRDLKLARTCFGDSIARYCPEFKGYESLNSKFFKAVTKPCDAAGSLVVGTVTLILAFISTKIF